MAGIDFAPNWDFALAHMPAVAQELSLLPAGLFNDFAAASFKQDTEQATDLVVEVERTTGAVRVRRRKFWNAAQKYGFDWSIRVANNDRRTEFDKLAEGFGDWYLYAYSADDVAALKDWWLLDLDAVRDVGVLLDRSYPTHDNGDGTAGLYIPIVHLIELGCVLSASRDLNAR